MSRRGRMRPAPSVPDIDLASPVRLERPTERFLLPVPVDSDLTVRSIAAVLSASARFKRLHGDFGQEVTALAHLLQPYGIHTQAVRMALSLTHQAGGRARGTAHIPNARLAYNGATLDDSIRTVRDFDIYFRSAYLANAAQRMQKTMDEGGSPSDALRREAGYYKAHENARKGRLEAVAQVQTAARHYGERDEKGTLLGWYLDPLLHNDVECITANGHNFYAEEGTVIGLPGSVHNNCGCYAGTPHWGATLVNDVFHNVTRLPRTRPTFKLKGRHTA